MPMPYGVGCACVFVGAWSYLVTTSAPTFLLLGLLLFELNGCHLLTTKPYCLTFITYIIMKKLVISSVITIISGILTSCALLFPTAANESLTVKLKSIEGCYSFYDDGVYIQEVIECKGSQEELYVKLLEFLTRTYNDASEVMQVKEKEQGLIICKGCYTFKVNDYLYGSDIEETAWHIYKAEIKDNKVRVTITLNEIDWYRPASTSGQYYTRSSKGSYSILDCPPYKTLDNQNEQVRKGYVFYYSVSNLIHIMDITKKALDNSPTYEDDSNW